MKDLVNCGMLGLAMIGCTMLIINKLNKIDERLENAYDYVGNYNYCTDKQLKERENYRRKQYEEGIEA